MGPRHPARIERGREVIGIDARPSDSIALAMRAAAPFYVASEVVDQEKAHLLSLDEETTRTIFGNQDAQPSDPDQPPSADPDEPEPGLFGEGDGTT